MAGDLGQELEEIPAPRISRYNDNWGGTSAGRRRAAEPVQAGSCSNSVFGNICKPRIHTLGMPHGVCESAHATHRLLSNKGAGVLKTARGKADMHMHAVLQSRGGTRTRLLVDSECTRWACAAGHGDRWTV